MPQFWREHGWSFVPATEFRLALAAIAALAWAVTYQAVRGSRKSLAGRLFVVFCLLMFLNAIWHVAARIDIGAHAPGVVTAVLLVFPTTSYLLLKARGGRPA